MEQFLYAADGYVRQDELFPALLQCRKLSHFEALLEHGLLPLFQAHSALLYQAGDAENPMNFLCRVNISPETDTFNRELIRRDPLENLLDERFAAHGTSVVAYDVDLPRRKLHETSKRIRQRQHRLPTVGKAGPPATLMLAYLHDNPPLRLRIQRMSPSPPHFRREDVLMMQSFACQCGLCVHSLMLREELHLYKSLASHLADALPAAAFVTRDGTVLIQNSAFESIIRFAKSLPSVLKQALQDPDKDRVELQGSSFWYKCHWLADGCRLLLLERRETAIPAWQRVAWPPELSHREREICQLVLEGLDNDAIAERLHLSYHTIKNHCRHIHEKVGVTNRVELVLVLLGSALQF